MLIPAFTIKLNNQIQQGLVVVGKFDGKYPALACATTGGKILLHSPHEGNQSSDNQLPHIRFLNFNRKITALASGSLDDKITGTNKPETLFIGTESSLLAYDVERNSDIYFREVQDGVNTLLVGKISTMQKPLVLTGGNCSILGFDKEGNEAFWTVTSDNVTALSLYDSMSNGMPDLMVGSEDSEIRTFRGEELITETSEADKITFLNSIQGTKFAYGLNNGTVGVYNGPKARLWRVKTKNRLTSMVSYDINNDGLCEVISGWNNGHFNVRNGENGDLIFRTTMSSPIAKLIKADYRSDGKEELMVCTESGEVKGFRAAEAEAVAVADSGVEIPKSEDEKLLVDLSIRKQELVGELRALERSVRSTKSAEAASTSSLGLSSATALSISLEPDLEAGYVGLKVSASAPDALIANVLVVDLEGAVLDGCEILTVSTALAAQSKSAVVPLRPVRNQACQLRVQAHVAARSMASQLHVFETTVSLPKFASFRRVDENKASQYATPSAQLTFRLAENFTRLSEYLSSAFLMPVLPKAADGKLKVFLVSVCNNVSQQAADTDAADHLSVQQPLHIIATHTTESGSSGLSIRIRCHFIETAAELLQDMAKYFSIEDLVSEADFPREFQQFEQVTQRVADYNAARIRLSAEMADDSQRVKALVIRAEDSRLMGDMPSMRRAYTELFSLNSQLAVGYNVRATNHAGLLAALKEVNLMIQKAANLRVGKAKQRVIADCRTSVKTNNLTSLLRIMRQGFDAAA